MEGLGRRKRAWSSWKGHKQRGAPRRYRSGAYGPSSWSVEVAQLSLAEDFNAAMLDIYRRAALELKYRPRVFLDMVTMTGGVATAKTLINAEEQSDGFTRLWQEGRLDLSVEAVVVEHPQWHPLFTAEDLARASQRLQAAGYQPKART